jgi:glycerophosphoryl diester phosphodiesterase
VWTVDDPDRMKALAAMGVSGIITNDPAGARAALTLTPRSEGG